MAPARTLGVLLQHAAAYLHFRGQQPAVHLFSILTVKKFLYHIVYFIIPVLLLAYPADLFLGKYLKKSHPYNDEFPIWNAIYEGKVNSDVVIYGSSTAWVHVNPQMLADSLHSSVYNLGMDGHNFWMQYQRHRSLLRYNKVPRIIIQTLDIFTLQKRDNLYNADQFLPYMFLNDDLQISTAKYEGYQPVDFALPLVRYYGKRKAITTAMWLSISRSGESPNRIAGFQSQNKAWTNDFTSAKLRMPAYEAKLDTASIHLFDRYLNECSERNIKMVFVYSPEYIDGQQFITNRAEVIALYEAFSKRYAIPFYNYSDDAITRDRSCYFNTLHLNKKGSTLFTSKLICDLKALGQ